MTRAAELPLRGQDALAAPAAGRPGTWDAVTAIADRALIGLVLATAVALPLVFSIAGPDVFALPKSALLWVVSMVAAGLLTVRLAASRAPGLRPRPIALLVGTFVCLNLVAWWLAVDRNHAILGEALQYQGLVSNLCYVLFLVIAMTTFGQPRRLRLLLAVVVIGALPVAGYAIIQWLRLDPIWPYLPKGRAFSTLGQANALGAYLVIGSAAAASLALTYRHLPRLLSIAALCLFAAAIAFTLSRGAYVAMGVVGMVYTAVLWHRVRRRQAVVPRAALAIGILALVVGGAALAPRAGPFIERAASTVDPDEDSVRGHFDLWNAGVRIAADHPLIGTGQDSFVLVFGAYRDEVLTPDRAAVMARYRPESPHNVYLATAVGSGLPSLAAYLGIALLAILGLIRVVRRAAAPADAWLAAGLLAAIVGHLVTDSFVTAEVTASWLFWLVLGASVGLANHDAQRGAAR